MNTYIQRPARVGPVPIDVSCFLRIHNALRPLGVYVGYQAGTRTRYDVCVLTAYLRPLFSMLREAPA